MRIISPHKKIFLLQSNYNPTFFFSFFFFVTKYRFHRSRHAIMPSFSTTVVFLLIKHSKKTNANANTCLSRLLYKSQYTNCAGTETELDIACANKDNAAAPAAANTTLTERLLCLYWEHPVPYKDEAAAMPHCGVHGSFDPWTHICRLD